MTNESENRKSRDGQRAMRPATTTATQTLSQTLAKLARHCAAVSSSLAANAIAASCQLLVASCHCSRRLQVAVSSLSPTSRSSCRCFSLPHSLVSWPISNGQNSRRWLRNIDAGDPGGNVWFAGSLSSADRDAGVNLWPRSWPDPPDPL